MIPDALNVAFIGNSNKNDFLNRLLKLYNSNNLPENDSYDINELIRIRKDELGKNQTNLVWNFNLKKKQTSVNLFSVENGLNNQFSECISQCEIALFYMNEEDIESDELKTNILLTNILGIKHAIVFIESEKDLNNTIKNLFTKRNFKNTKLSIISNLSKDSLDVGFSKYFRTLDNIKNKSIQTKLNISVSNMFDLSAKYTVLNGTILEGTLNCGDFIKNTSNGTIHKIIDMQVQHKNVEKAKRGSYVGIKVNKTDLIDVGDVIINVKEKSICKKSDNITCQLLMINDILEPNSDLILNFLGRDHYVKVFKIQKIINKLNKTIERNPETLNAKQTGMIILHSREKINMTNYSDNYKLGSFTIRKSESNNKIIGVGIVKNLK